MPDTDAILTTIKDQSVALAKKLGKQFANQATADAQDYLEKARADLDRWTGELLREEIDEDDLQSLVRGRADLAEMRALKQAGLAKVTIDTFTQGVLDIAVSAISSAVKLG